MGFIGNTSRPSGGRPGREPVYTLVLLVSLRTKLLTVTNPDGVEKAGGGDTLRLRGPGLWRGDAWS